MLGAGREDPHPSQRLPTALPPLLNISRTEVLRGGQNAALAAGTRVRGGGGSGKWTEHSLS